jgi:hypothetical protein
MKALLQAGIKVALVAMLLAALCVTQGGGQVSSVMDLHQASQVRGGDWSWGRFLSGMQCGAGIMAIIGTNGAILLVPASGGVLAVGTLVGCANMLGANVLTS